MTLVRTAKKEKKEPAKLSLMDYRLLIALSLLLPCLFLLAAFTSHFIPSNSMIPTLNPGDHIVTMKSWLAYPFGAKPQRGDIIIFRLEDGQVSAQDGSGETDILIKRIVGLPNETIFIDRKGIVYINGGRLIESHGLVPDSPKLKDNYVYAVGVPYKIPPDQYFALGDNRLTSFDSRYWGCVHHENIIGRFARVLYHDDGYKSPEPTK